MKEPFLKLKGNQTDQQVYSHQKYFQQPKRTPSDENGFNQTGDQTGDRINHLRPQSSSRHVRSLIATIILIAGVTIACILRFQSDPSLTTNWCIGICCISYVLYLFMGCCSNKLRQYLSKIENVNVLSTYYSQLRASIGHFSMSAECYHSETRTDYRTVTDSDGNSKTETDTYTVSVTTHQANELLTPYSTIDKSG
jgi:hypothetical protein